MKNIRHNVFETNSSSTHSVSINAATDGIYDTIIPNQDGSITIDGGEYGWEWSRHNTAEIKASYAAVYAINSPSKTSMLIDVIKEHTGAKKVILNLSSDHSDINYSYIDHQSIDVCAKAFESKEILKDFIFSPGSWLFTGNDNDYAPPNFYDVDTNIVYTHELVVEGTDKTVKFIQTPSFDDILEAILSLKLNIKDYQICHKSAKTYDGKSYSSYKKIKSGILELHKTKPVYSRERPPKFIGYKVEATKELKIKINKLKYDK